MAPGALAQVLRQLRDLPLSSGHDRLLSGIKDGDDAAVYILDDCKALIFTADFFAPMVDDAWTFGAIAAANALSDIYAMGGSPILALNLAAFPVDLPRMTISEIFRGGAEKVQQAGAIIGGGHSVRNTDPKYGLAVLGVANRANILGKRGARPGDLLYLSKPLGTGIVMAGIRKGRVDREEIEGAEMTMLLLNRAAAEAASACGAVAATDITGFGFAGHTSEMIDEVAGIGFEIDAKRLPILPGALRLIEEGIGVPGARDNEDFFGERTEFCSSLPQSYRDLCFGAETSGGLLIALPPKGAQNFEKLLPSACPVGVVIAGAKILVR